MSQSLNKEAEVTTKLREKIQDLQQNLDGISETKNELLKSLESKEEDLQAAKSKVKLIAETVREKEGVIESLKFQVSEIDEIKKQNNALINLKDEEMKEKIDALKALECEFSKSRETWEKEKTILKDLLIEEQRINSEIRLLYQEDIATDGEYPAADVTIVEDIRTLSDDDMQ